MSSLVSAEANQSLDVLAWVGEEEEVRNPDINCLTFWWYF